MQWSETGLIGRTSLFGELWFDVQCVMCGVGALVLIYNGACSYGEHGVWCCVKK